MGFDNECIVNIQTLPGEYFCPVCRTLVYPSEALQAQCTHLYCKPCLAYVVATTRACPYDGYLVTEADAKPLTESNKSVADGINSIQVHCLFHRSGCQWLGSFLDCISHCTDCTFGNSPVVCNRCGTQIIHRQVQEHAQICPGVQPQAQQIEGSQAQASVDQSLAVSHVVPQSSQDPASQSSVGSASAPPVAPAANSGAVSAPASVPTSTVAQPQAVAQTAPTPEQWYQQQQIQYQQYYQQYPGYDPYQQHYQQYGQLQQQMTSQYQQPQVQSYPQQASQLQQHPQPYAQPQSLHPHSQPQSQPQLQAQQLPLQSQPPGHQQAHGHVSQSQIPQQTLSAPVGVPQPQVQMPPQANPPAQGQVPTQQMGFPPPQSYQVAAQPPQLQSQSRPQLQQPVGQQQQLAPMIPQLQQQPAQQHFYPQPLSGLPHTQTQHIHSQTQPQFPPTHAVTGHQSYPQPQLVQQPTTPQQPATSQQAAPQQPAAPQQRPVHVYPQQQGPYQPSQYPPQLQNQFSPHQPQLRLPHPNALPNQPSSEQTIHQRSGFQPSPVQQSLPSNQIHGQPPQPHRDSFPPHHLVPPQQALRPQGLPYAQQPLPAQPSPQGVAGRPMIGNFGVMQQAFGVPPGVPANIQQNNSKQSFDQTYHPGQQLQQTLPGVATQQSDSMAGKVGQSAAAVIKTSPRKNVSENIRIRAEMSQAVEGNKGKTAGEADDAEPAREIKNVSESLSDHQKVKLQEPSVTRPVKEEFAEDKSPKGGALVSDDVRNDMEGQPDNNFSRESVKGQREQDENAVCVQTGEDLENQKPLHDKLQPAFQDKKLAQFPYSSTFGGDHRNFPSGEMPSKVAGPPGHPSQTHKQEGYPKQLLPCDPSQNMPHAGTSISQIRPNPDRRFPEIPPHQIPPTLGQPLAPPPMRPPLQGFFPENIRPDVFQPPVERPPGQFHSGPPSGAFLGAGAPSSLARGSAYHDPNLFPQGLIPPFRAGGNMGQVEPLRAPPTGVFEAPGMMWGSAPPIGVEGQAVRPGFPKPVEGEMLPGGISDYYNSRQHEPGGPMERPNFLKMNGDSGAVLEPVFHNPTEGRFRAFPEERYKHMFDDGFTHPADERFRQFPLDHSSRSFVDRREFEEDLKQFPRPSNLEGDGASKFKNYSLPSRAFEMGSRVLGPDAGSRPFDRFDGDGRYKFDSNATAMTSRRVPLAGSPGAYAEQRMEPSERHKFFGDNLGRDPSHPDHHGPASELGRLNKDGHFRSPAKNITGPPFNKFGDYSEREPQGFGERSRLSSLSSPSRITNHLYRNDLGCFDNPRVGDRLLAGAPDVPDFMQNHLRNRDFFSSHVGSLRFGGSHSHMRMDETVGFAKFAPHLPNMEPIGGTLHSHFNSGLLHNDFIDHSRRRRLGNVGWCRICKIDCDSVEGLDLHSQTREHQNMAMDIVLRIKQDNAKRQKPSDVSNSNDDMKSKKINGDNESKEKKPTGESHRNQH